MEKAYSRFFNLKLNPFGETPDAHFYFDSKTHNNALNKLEWAIEQGRGFTLLTGEVGTGKTLVSRMLIQDLDARANTALVLYPRLTELELLRTLASEFEIAFESQPETSKQYLDAINEFLLASALAGRKSVLIIDEAQNLPLETLECVRMLSNLETEREKLLHIILVAQPELRVALEGANLRQLNQRIAVSLTLDPLSRDETERYIKHRLETAGMGNLVRLDPEAMRLVHERSGGIPRRINGLCEMILLSAQKDQVRLIDGKLARTILGKTGKRRALFGLFQKGGSA